MKQLNETLNVAFSTQKGGAGKTTLTVLVASYLHYVKGYNVAIVDCDYPQHSIYDMRKRNQKAAIEDDYYKVMAYEQIKRLDGKKFYRVLKSRPEDAIFAAQSLLDADDELDFIFYDLPGTVNDNGVISTISQMDYVFSPISADYVVLDSTLRFADTLNNKLVTTGKSDIKGLWLVWNMVDGREKTELYEVYEKVIEQLGLQVLKTFIPDSKRFRRENTLAHRTVFRSTVFPMDKSLIKGSNIDLLVDEMLTIMGQKG
jgi:cellulose biosynthesis protein BcsQ